MSREDQKEALQYRRLHFLSQSGGDGDTTLTRRKNYLRGRRTFSRSHRVIFCDAELLARPGLHGCAKRARLSRLIAFSLSLSHPPFLGGARGGVNCRIDL